MRGAGAVRHYDERPAVEPTFRLPSMLDPRRRPLGRIYRDYRPTVQVPVPVIGEPRRPVDDPQRWLSKVYQLCADGKVNPAIDFVLNTLDELLFARDVTTCDVILSLVDVHKMPPVVLLAFLSETLRAGALLPTRRDLLQRIEERLLLERSRERVEALLGGLR